MSTDYEVPRSWWLVPVTLLGVVVVIAIAVAVIG